MTEVVPPPYEPPTRFTHPMCEVHGCALFDIYEDSPKAVRRPYLEIPQIEAGQVLDEFSVISLTDIKEGYVPTRRFHFVTPWLPDGEMEHTGTFRTYYENRRFGLFAVAPVSSVTSEVMRQREARQHLDVWVDAERGLMGLCEWEYRTKSI